MQTIAKKKTRTITFRLSDVQHALVARKAAAFTNCNLSDWILEAAIMYEPVDRDAEALIETIDGRCGRSAKNRGVKFEN